MLAVTSLEIRTRVVVSLKVSSPGGSIMVYVVLTMGPGPVDWVLCPPGEDEIG